MNSLNNKMFILVIVVLLVTSSYMTTAFFIKAWPFHKQIESEVPEETIEFLDGLGVESYKISNGSRLLFDDFSIIYPDGWILMNVDDSDSIVGVNSLSPNTSVSISKIEFNASSSLNIIDLLGTKVDIWYKTAEIEYVNFLERECIIFSGVIDKIDRTDGMIVFAIPSGNSYFLLTGVFEPETKSQESIEGIFETFRLSIE